MKLPWVNRKLHEQELYEADLKVKVSADALKAMAKKLDIMEEELMKALAAASARVAPSGQVILRAGELIIDLPQAVYLAAPPPVQAFREPELTDTRGFSVDVPYRPIAAYIHRDDLQVTTPIFVLADDSGAVRRIVCSKFKVQTLQPGRPIHE
jgi:hypothetical protein